MAPRQKRGVIDDADWERVRPVIYRLYMKESRSQRDTLVALGTFYDFHPSKAQLEWKIKQWRMVRNLANLEWKYVVNKIRKRRSRGKESQVYLSGIQLRPATVDKARSRHCYESAIEKTMPYSMLKAPPNFNVSIQNLADKVFQLALRNGMIHNLAYTKKLQYTYQTLSLMMSEQPWGNHIVMAESLLAQSGHGFSSGALEVLAFLLSNNFFEQWDMLSELPTDLIDLILGALQRTNLWTLGMPQHYSSLPFSIQALLEGLFKEAIQRSNLEAVRWLLQVGVDVNLPLDGMLFENKFRIKKTMKPFVYAALVYDMPLVNLLIEHGADCRINSLRAIFHPRERRLQVDSAWVPSIKLMLSKYEFHLGDEVHTRHLLNEISSLGRSCISETVVETQSSLTMDLLAEHINHIDAVSTFKETPLTAAASEGNMGLCAHLLQLGASLRSCSGIADKFPVATPLQCAAYFADMAMVIQLLDAGADPNDCHPCETEPQHVRCIPGPAQQQFFDGEFSTKTGNIGRTALQAALLGGKTDNALLLLSKGARFVGGELTTVILNRQDSVMSHLIDSKASLMDTPASPESISVLEAAVIIKDPRLIQRVIKTNQNSIGPKVLLAALWVAKATSDLTTVQHLLKEYADLGIRDDPWLGTVISLAAALDLAEVIRTIFRLGIRPVTAVHTPSLGAETTRKLSRLEPGAANLQEVYFEWRSWLPKNEADEAYYWPLIHVAVRTMSRGDSECTDWLLSLNLDLNEPEKDGLNLYQQAMAFQKTPLQVAARMGDMDLLDRLIRLGASINAPPYFKSGATALQAAAIQGFFGIVQKLLNLDADPNASGAELNGRTALEDKVTAQLQISCGLTDHGLRLIKTFLKKVIFFTGIKVPKESQTDEGSNAPDTFDEDPYGVDTYIQEAAVKFWEPVYDHLTWEIA
ncbi:ankyrin repeat-containing domain protein [Colletotrichum musicola]|uniref:Ankyrin repeat-containing domain protein n=1 Tax=Colletotrichum musicola TaxID=2175873 RepID=A0A8H6KDA0_9PEZI|nr:ankyrin repeat-containing domain protein [Colletotrichum musicola]